MKLKLHIALIGLLALTASFAAAYAYGITSADRLKGKSLFCSNPVSLAEAREALDTNDLEWADSINACVVTFHDYRVKVLRCDVSSCLVRYFDKTTGVGYVEHGSLYKS